MDAKAEAFLAVSVGMIMLAMGLGLTTDDFRRIKRAPRAVVVGMVGQLVGPLGMVSCFVPVRTQPHPGHHHHLLLLACRPASGPVCAAAGATGEWVDWLYSVLLFRLVRHRTTWSDVGRVWSFVE